MESHRCVLDSEEIDVSRTPGPDHRERKQGYAVELAKESQDTVEVVQMDVGTQISDPQTGRCDSFHV